MKNIDFFKQIKERERKRMERSRDQIAKIVNRNNSIVNKSKNLDIKKKNELIGQQRGDIKKFALNQQMKFELLKKKIFKQMNEDKKEDSKKNQFASMRSGKRKKNMSRHGDRISYHNYGKNENEGTFNFSKKDTLKESMTDKLGKSSIKSYKMDSLKNYKNIKKKLNLKKNLKGLIQKAKRLKTSSHKKSEHHFKFSKKKGKDKNLTDEYSPGSGNKDFGLDREDSFQDGRRQVAAKANIRNDPGVVIRGRGKDKSRSRSNRIKIKPGRAFYKKSKDGRAKGLKIRLKEELED